MCIYITCYIYIEYNIQYMYIYIYSACQSNFLLGWYFWSHRTHRPSRASERTLDPWFLGRGRFLGSPNKNVSRARRNLPFLWSFLRLLRAPSSLSLLLLVLLCAFQVRTSLFDFFPRGSRTWFASSLQVKSRKMGHHVDVP